MCSIFCVGETPGSAWGCTLGTPSQERSRAHQHIGSQADKCFLVSWTEIWRCPVGESVCVGNPFRQRGR